MTRSDGDRVADILEACDRGHALVARGRETYDSDDAVVPATERFLEIIGEAATQLSDSFKAARPDVPWTNIVGLRVRLAHHYHRIDPDLVWEIACRSIPALASSLRDEGDMGVPPASD